MIKELTTILVLNRQYNDKVKPSAGMYHGKPAMLVNSVGEQEELTCFDQDSSKLVETHKSCLVNWKNHLFIYGGETETRQISRLTGHSLERVGNLTFDHSGEACCVMANQFIFICSSTQCKKSTSSFWEHFSEPALSTHDHSTNRISCSDSKLQ